MLTGRRHEAAVLRARREKQPLDVKAREAEAWSQVRAQLRVAQTLQVKKADGDRAGAGAREV